MSSVPDVSLDQKARPRFGVRLFWLGLAVPVSAGLVGRVLQRYEIPFGLRIALALVPLLPLGVGVWIQKQAEKKSDELARHIARDAFVFAFCALSGLFVCVDVLRVGDVLPDFVWDSKRLLPAMGLMLAVGYGWSSWRYH